MYWCLISAHDGLDLDDNGCFHLNNKWLNLLIILINQRLNVGRE